MPAPDGSDDFVGIGGPGEGLGVIVGFAQEGVDGGLEIDDRSEHAAFEAALAELGEEALHGIEPGARGGGEVEHEAGMTIEPGPRLGMLMRAVIVEDDVDDPAYRDLGLDGVQKADEFLVPVTLHAAPDNLAFEDIERGEQGGGAVSLVIMRHRAGSPFLDRQAWLGAVERLDLRFLVDREHDGMGRRIDIKPDDVAQLGGELRVGGQLELAHPMRLQAVGAPDALHRGDADPGGLGHHVGGPVGRLAGRVLLSKRDHPLGDLRPQGRDARRPRLVAQQPLGALQHEPCLPAPHAGFALASTAHDLDCAEAGGGQQHDPRPPDMFLRAVPVRSDRFQTSTVGRAHINNDILAHPPDSHPTRAQGIPFRILPSGFLH